MTYKSLDSSDHIVYIGGVESKGVDRSASWCLPGKHQALLEGAFLGADMALSDAQQMALSDALQPNSKRSLMKRAREVWANSERVKAHLETRLGEHVSFAASKGGMSLWMRLSKSLDVASMTALLASFRHAIVPGALVSHEADANHWLAVNVTLDDVEPLAKALAEHLVVDEVELITDPVELIIEETEEEVLEPLEATDLVEANEQTEELVEAIESDLAQPQKEAKKSRNATTEPLYNPMLDLINHDFG